MTRRCQVCGSARVVPSLLFRCVACGRLACPRCRGGGERRCRECGGKEAAIRSPALLRDERGQAEALLAAAFLVLLAAFVSGYLSVATAVRHKERLTAAAVAAARAAAAEVDPDSFITGQASIDPQRARQRFDAAFPGLAGLNADWTAPPPPVGSPPEAAALTGRVNVVRFDVYSAQNAGQMDCGGQPVAGPGVCVSLTAPGRVILPGGVPYDFTISTVARAAAPSFGAGGWQYQ